jgi:hypothetical protein
VSGEKPSPFSDRLFRRRRRRYQSGWRYHWAGVDPTRLTGIGSRRRNDLCAAGRCNISWRVGPRRVNDFRGAVRGPRRPLVSHHLAERLNLRLTWPNSRICSIGQSILGRIRVVPQIRVIANSARKCGRGTQFRRLVTASRQSAGDHNQPNSARPAIEHGMALGNPRPLQFIH